LNAFSVFVLVNSLKRNLIFGADLQKDVEYVICDHIQDLILERLFEHVEEFSNDRLRIGVFLLEVANDIHELDAQAEENVLVLLGGELGLIDQNAIEHNFERGLDEFIINEVGSGEKTANIVNTILFLV